MAGLILSVVLVVIGLCDGVIYNKLVARNDHPAIRESFAGTPMRSVPMTYAVSGGAAAYRVDLIRTFWRGGRPDPRPSTSQLPIF